MSRAAPFDFNSDLIARGYDDVLVPAMFEPWARWLLDEEADWAGKSVLDLASGTGIVTALLAARVGPEGSVQGADINPEMLQRARKRCRRIQPRVEFLVSGAHPLQVRDDSIDIVVCQQGFQFFPERAEAAREIRRVLKAGGRVLVSTWCPVTECRLFGAITTALESLEEPELAARIRVPFDFLPPAELRGHFEAADFADVAVRPQIHELILAGGGEHAVRLAYATPIGPGLRELSADKQVAFRRELIRLVGELGSGPTSMGPLVANVLTATRP